MSGHAGGGTTEPFPASRFLNTPMDATLEIDLSAFDRFADRLIESTDPSKGGAMEAAALQSMDAYMDAARTHFDVSSQRGGDWAEHAPSTIKRRGAGAPILIEGGDLRESLERTDTNHVLSVDHEGVTEGTADPKARFHQDGTDNMPAREILEQPEANTLDEMKTPLVSGVQTLVREVATT